MRNAGLSLIIGILCLVHVLSLGKAADLKKALPRGEGSAYVLPPAFLKITAGEFDGIASDFMFFQGLVFMGSTYERSEWPRVKQWEWKWLFNVLRASTVLDPYFRDPYYFANAHLTWAAGMVEETNSLLEQGVRYRTWDGLLPFYAGVNNFYFLHNYAKASEYLMEASRRPGASPIYVSLASKLAYKGKRTENAIAFLEYSLEKEEDPQIKQEYEMRVTALKNILQLEQVTARYRATYGNKPHKITDLVAKKLITSLPIEPYGGSYYLNESGEVKTTMERWLVPYIKK